MKMMNRCGQCCLTSNNECARSLGWTRDRLVCQAPCQAHCRSKNEKATELEDQYAVGNNRNARYRPTYQQKKDSHWQRTQRQPKCIPNIKETPGRLVPARSEVQRQWSQNNHNAEPRPHAVLHLRLNMKIEPERIGIDHRNRGCKSVQKDANVSMQEPRGNQIAAPFAFLIGDCLQLMKVLHQSLL